MQTASAVTVIMQEKFARMAVYTYAMESMSYRTAAILDEYQEPDTAVEAAMVKVRHCVWTPWSRSDIVCEQLRSRSNIGCEQAWSRSRHHNLLTTGV